MIKQALVKIPNFEKYNQRRDVKGSSWFRMENDFFIDPDIIHLETKEKLFYIYLISLASKCQGNEFKLDFKLCTTLTGINLNEIDLYLKNLSEINKITYTNAHERERSETCLRTDERTNERTNEGEQKKLNYTPHEFEADFNALKPKSYVHQRLPSDSYQDFINTCKAYPDRETWLKVLNLAFDSYLIDKNKKIKISLIVKESIFTKFLNGEYNDENSPRKVVEKMEGYFKV